MGIHSGMDKCRWLTRLFTVKSQCAAVNVRVPVSNGPFRCFASIRTAKIAVTIDEIPGCVRVLLQRPENLRTGRHPVGGRDQPLEPETADKLSGFGIELPLSLHEKASGLLIAGQPLIGHVPQGAKADSTLVWNIAINLQSVPGRKRLVERAIFP